MAEVRDRRIMVNVEQSIADRLEMLLGKEGIPTSTYIRSLIVQDLIKRGLMTNEDIYGLALGVRP